MEGTWNVYFEDRPVGNCKTHREGLYIRFVCRCARVSDSICRLLLRCGNGNVDLGILVPVEGTYPKENLVFASNSRVNSLRNVLYRCGIGTNLFFFPVFRMRGLGNRTEKRGFF